MGSGGPLVPSAGVCKHSVASASPVGKAGGSQAGGCCEVQRCVNTWYRRFWFLFGLISLEAGRQGWVGATVRSFCASRLTSRAIRPNLSLSVAA